MRFYSLFNEKNVILDITETNRENILTKAISLLIPNIEQKKITEIIDKLTIHEDSPWFEPAEGVIIPHARIEDINDFFIAVIISKDGLIWQQNTNGNKIVNLIFIILTPTYQNMRMIQTLDAISRFCELKHNVESLANVKSFSRAIKVIEESDIEIKPKLTAEYLMETQIKTISPNYSLREAAAILVKFQEDAVAVVNEKNELLGEITSEALLKIGVPNYMNLLSNVDFISNFEPFENYYKKERFMKISELLSSRIITTHPEASVIEVAYNLISAGLRRIYVVQDKKLVGIIYRRDIVSKILLA